MVAVAVAMAVAGGAVASLGDVWTAITGKDRDTRQRAEQRIGRDTPQGMGNRFAIGAAIGGALGVGYAALCLVRRTDP